MNIEYFNGDLIEYIESNQVTAVAHNCNCFHTMGAGIALMLNDYTGGRLLKEDKETTYGDINKLGLYSTIIYNDIQYFNLYGMYVYKTLIKNPKPNNVYVHWDSLKDALCRAIIESRHGKFCIPIMGCNHAGGHTDQFIDMIEEVCELVQCYDVDASHKTLVIISKE